MFNWKINFKIQGQKHITQNVLLIKVSVKNPDSQFLKHKNATFVEN